MSHAQPLAPILKDIRRLAKVLAPASTATLRRVRHAYAAYSDAAVIGLCREKSADLAAELTALLHTHVAGEQLCLLCLDIESWAERQAWERLIAGMAVLMALTPEEAASTHQRLHAADLRDLSPLGEDPLGEDMIYDLSPLDDAEDGLANGSEDGSENSSEFDTDLDDEDSDSASDKDIESQFH